MGDNLLDFGEISSKALDEMEQYKRKLIQLFGKAKFMQNEGLITNSEYNKLLEESGYRYFLSTEVNRFTENVLYYRYRLIDLYERMIKLFKQYKTGLKNINDCPLLENEAMEFLKYVNAYELYSEIERNNMIIDSEKATKTGVCIDIGGLSYIYYKAPYTRVCRPKSVTTVHEMGHAVSYFHLQNENRQLFSRNISSEIMSICFEKLFFDFLRERELLDPSLIDSMIKSTETVFCEKAVSFKRALDSFDYPEQNFQLNSITLRYNIDNLKYKCDLANQAYIIGDLGSAKLFADYQQDKGYFIRHLGDVIKHINSLSFEEVLDEYGTVEPMKDYLDKHLVLKPKKKDVR